MKSIKLFEEFLNERKDPKGVEWPKELLSRNDDVLFKLERAMSDRAKYEILDAETKKTFEYGGIVFGRVSELEAYADDYVRPQGSGRSSRY
jgi:hypothetical protein